MRSVVATRFQEAVLRFRSHCHIMNAGGRGSGKTTSLALHVVDHCRDFGSDARPLVIRESWSGLQQLSDELLELCRAAFGSADRNKAEGTITLGNGAIIQLTQIADEASYSKHQGKSFTGLFADEAGNYAPAAWAFLRRVRSNLRVPPGRRPDIHMTANPHGRAHTIIFREFVSKAPPWHPFEDEHGEWWVWTTSDLTMNPHINQESYRRQLLAACGRDQKLAEAWLRGSWDVLGGVMFDAFDPAIHIIPAPQTSMLLRCGGDWGTAAPATCILAGQLRQSAGRVPFGSIVCLDEVDTADPADLSLGTGAPPQAFAEMIKEMCARNGWQSPEVVMDDARGLQSETVIQLLEENGIAAWKPFAKDRVGQWSLIRQLLSNAVTGDGPGLFFTSRCPHLIETLPEAPRGTLRPEDLDPKWNRDHWLDAGAYVIRDIWTNRVRQGRAVGLV
jgi:hypothetical protein